MLRKKSSRKSEPLVVSSLNKQVRHSVLRRAKVKYLAGIARLKRLMREYRVPSVATLAFLAVILGFAVLRQFERTSLIGLINQVSAGEGGYANLLSTDEAQQFERNDITEVGQNNSNTSNTQNSDSTQSTSTAFVIDSGTGDSAGSSGSGGSSGGGDTRGGGDTGGGGSSGGDTGGGGTTPPPDPFTAEIGAFNQGTTSLQCKNPGKPNVNNCTKTYSFSGSIRSFNGPGSVNYSWQSSTSGGNGSGSYTAGSGTSVTAVSKQVTLDCKSPISFSILLAISSPTSTASNTINVNHNCNEI